MTIKNVNEKTNWGKTFATHITEKELILVIYNIKPIKENNPMERWTKSLYKQFTKDVKTLTFTHVEAIAI